MARPSIQPNYLAIAIATALDVERADERRRSAQHEGVRSIGWLGFTWRALASSLALDANGQ